MSKLAIRADRKTQTTDDGAFIGPCVFCGKPLMHVDHQDEEPTDEQIKNGAAVDRGLGLIIGGVLDGASEFFLYCIDGNCPTQTIENMWRCGCEGDFVENVGDVCHACKKHRRDASDYYYDEPCPKCHRSEMCCHERLPVQHFFCDHCGWEGFHNALSGRLDDWPPEETLT